MEVKLDPRAVEAINDPTPRKDWRTLARRIEAAEGRWQLVMLVPDVTRLGIAEYVRVRLRDNGCRAQVVGLLGPAGHRPWTGIAVFARVGRGNSQEQRAIKRIAEVAARD